MRALNRQKFNFFNITFTIYTKPKICFVFIVHCIIFGIIINIIRNIIAYWAIISFIEKVQIIINCNIYSFISINIINIVINITIYNIFSIIIRTRAISKWFFLASIFISNYWINIIVNSLYILVSFNCLINEFLFDLVLLLRQ